MNTCCLLFYVRMETKLINFYCFCYYPKVRCTRVEILTELLFDGRQTTDLKSKTALYMVRADVRLHEAKTALLKSNPVAGLGVKSEIKKDVKRHPSIMTVYF